MVFDTDVLIWFLRGNEKAQKKILSQAPFKISAAILSAKTRWHSVEGWTPLSAAALEEVEKVFA